MNMKEFNSDKFPTFPPHWELRLHPLFSSRSLVILSSPRMWIFSSILPPPISKTRIHSSILLRTHFINPMENAIAGSPGFQTLRFPNFNPEPTAPNLLFFAAPVKKKQQLLKLTKTCRGVVFAKSVSSASAADESGVEQELRPTEIKEAVNPVYKPTPFNRHLRTPHSGYHFDGSARPFFEGWYFKVSIPECRQSFCFMYSVENPAFTKRLSTLEVLQYGSRFTGVGAQILGADDKYICQYTEESTNFWGSRHELMLGNTFTPQKNMRVPNKEVPPRDFNKRVMEGFQVTPLWNQGHICDDGGTNYAEIVKTARWEYSTRPIYGWGNVNSKQKSTAGWLAAFPVFEPHWQICMAGGLSTGWIEWDGEMFEFENAPSYSEKNWGGGFPRKWFWVQSNVFEGASGEVALTAAGGLRQLPGLTATYENAALVGIHFGGTFYEFVPWNGVLTWEIAQWGHWFIAAENETHKVELVATTKEPGTTLRAPTMEAGLAPACKDTCVAELTLQLWERRSDGSKGNIILDVTSNMAAVEVGGGPWFSPWKGKTNTPEIVKHALTVPVDVEGLLDVVPLLKPPGL